MVRRYSDTGNGGGVVMGPSDEDIRRTVLQERDNARLVVLAQSQGKTRARRRGDLRELLDMLGLLTDEQTQEALKHALNRQVTRPLTLAADRSFRPHSYLPEPELAAAN
jgi:hypothetical protein